MLPQGFQRGKPDIAGQKKSQREGETTTEGDSPDIIVYVNATTEERFVPHVLCAEVADGALQLALLHIAAPEALASFAIDLDEERIDALRLGPVAVPELVGCDRHQRDCALGANVGLGLVLEDERRGADGGDEVPHCLLHLRLLGQTREAAGRVPGVDPRRAPGGFWNDWLGDATRALRGWDHCVERHLATLGKAATTLGERRLSGGADDF